MVRLTGLILIMALIFGAAAQPKRIKLLTFRFLGRLDYEYGKTPVPEKLKKLEGLYVKMRGYLAPISGTKGMTEFVLLPAPLVCCFLEAPPIIQQVWVKMKPPLKVDYVDNMVTLKGTLHIEEKTDGKVLKSLNHMEADFIEVK